MIDVWPDDWRAQLAATFDAERDGPPEILIAYVAEDGRYTGDVWRIRVGSPGRMEHDLGRVGQRATGTVPQHHSTSSRL